MRDVWNQLWRIVCFSVFLSRCCLSWFVLPVMHQLCRFLVCTAVADVIFWFLDTDKPSCLFLICINWAFLLRVVWIAAVLKYLHSKCWTDFLHVRTVGDVEGGCCIHNDSFISQLAVASWSITKRQKSTNFSHFCISWEWDGLIG